MGAGERCIYVYKRLQTSRFLFLMGFGFGIWGFGARDLELGLGLMVPGGGPLTFVCRAVGYNTVYVQSTCSGDSVVFRFRV